jgi:hypothetical protein
LTVKYSPVCVLNNSQINNVKHDDHYKRVDIYCYFGVMSALWLIEVKRLQDAFKQQERRLFHFINHINRALKSLKLDTKFLSLVSFGR